MTTPATVRTARSDWFTSTRSNNGNQCVEVRFVDDAVLVRDSKYRRDPAAHPGAEPLLAVSVSEWTAFLAALTRDENVAVVGDARVASDTLSARPMPGDHTVLTCGGTALTFTGGEWDAFLAGAADGEFDPRPAPVG